jgi:hypothetical protein
MIKRPLTRSIDSKDDRNPAIVNISCRNYVPVTTSEHISKGLILKLSHVLHSALDASPLDLLLRLARARGLAIALLVNAPHVDVENDNGSQLHGVADQHAARDVSWNPLNESQVRMLRIDLRNVG